MRGLEKQITALDCTGGDDQTFSNAGQARNYHHPEGQVYLWGAAPIEGVVR